MKRIQSDLTLFLVGTTGDLAKRRIIKAIYKLFSQNILPKNFRLIGNARNPMTDSQYRDFIKKIVEPTNEAQWKRFCTCTHYVPGDVTQVDTFTKITKFLEDKGPCGDHLWYISTHPSLYTHIIKNIKATGLNQSDCGWTKILIEKPFGTDLKSSQQLNKEILNVFTEDQIYRIDHFLAKETVQNLLAFRFANDIFEHLWSNKYIDHIQVLVSETRGLDGRVKFYDPTGETRDMVQSHILQMIATVLMEEPLSVDPDEIRRKRRKLLNHLRLADEYNIGNCVKFGQYTSSRFNSKKVKGYLEEDDAPRSSKTETAVAIKCFIENHRWRGVPIYIKAGKRLKQSTTEISIQFNKLLNPMFNNADNQQQQGNVLTLRIQPNEGIVIRLKVKKPGLTMELQEAPMQFCYNTEFQMGLVNAYEKLIYDAVNGDISLFPHARGIEASWKFVQKIIDYQQSADFMISQYPAGSWGPDSFDELIEKDGRHWIPPSIEVCEIVE